MDSYCSWHVMFNAHAVLVFKLMDSYQSFIEMCSNHAVLVLRLYEFVLGLRKAAVSTRIKTS